MVGATHDSNFFGSMCTPFRDHSELYSFHANELDGAYDLVFSFLLDDTLGLIRQPPPSGAAKHSANYRAQLTH